MLNHYLNDPLNTSSKVYFRAMQDDILLSLGMYPKINHAGVHLDKIGGRRESGWCWQWWWRFQHTVVSSGGQWCLRGSAVTMHSVSLHHTHCWSFLTPFHSSASSSPTFQDPSCHCFTKESHPPTITHSCLKASSYTKVTTRGPRVDHSLTFCRLFLLSAAADMLQKALIIQWHSR